MPLKSFSARLSSVLLFISIAYANTASTVNQPAFVDEFFQKEFQTIKDQIAGSKTLSKSAAGEYGGAILDSAALILAGDRDPLDVALRRTRALLVDLKKNGLANADGFEARLDRIKQAGIAGGLAKTSDESTARHDLYMKTMALQREIALSNPLMDFDSVLFVATRVPNIGPEGHIVCDFQGYIYGGVAGDGQSLFILKGLKTGNPAAINMVANSTIQNGRFPGQTLKGGAFMSPDLSYDGKRVAFAWREPGPGFGGYTGDDKAFNKEYCWHIFTVNVDGSNLLQLTDGDYSDFDPCWLPNGRIAFVSERRRGYGRCHGWQGRTYTIHSMKDDGSDLYCIDYHETNEWQPSVDNDGMIVYGRWDYVDRDAVIAHNMWKMNPDGRDSRSYHGNYPLPWSTIPGSLFFGTGDGKDKRPWTELYIRAIPGSTRYIATASGHHTYPYGDLILIDISVPDDNKSSQVTGITTDRTWWYDKSPDTYQSAWPLSESYYLCSYQSDLLLLDKAGNKQVLFTSSKAPGVSGGCRCNDPIPLRPRKKSPEISMKTFQGERKQLPEHRRAVISVLNVYNSDIPLPEGVKIKEFRVVQLIPKATQNNDWPKTNYGTQALCRMSMGTAPVETDGSVYCEAPVGKTLYFQILDEHGCAVHSMRSAAWVHDGEHLTCVGCHEDKWKTTPAGPRQLALQRPPSKLKPEYGDSVEPLTFYRAAKPVLDAKCAPCHKKQGKGPDMSYGSLGKFAFCYDGVGGNQGAAPGNGIYHGSRTTPGKHGALQSLLITHLDSTHHGADLMPEERRRITYWLDVGSMELGAYTRVEEQRAGKRVWPELDCDSTNPQGIENDFPIMEETPPNSAGNSNHSTVQPLEIRLNGTVLSIANPHQAEIRISLIDLMGRCRYEKIVRQHQALVNVDLRTWQAARGIYILKAFADNKSSASVVAAMVY